MVGVQREGLRAAAAAVCNSFFFQTGGLVGFGGGAGWGQGIHATGGNRMASEVGLA